MLIFTLALSLATALDTIPALGRCIGARTTVSTEACLTQVAAESDSGVARAERRTRAKLGSATGRAAFDRAAAAWRTYRERECRAIYAVYEPGTVAGTALLECRITLAEQRTRFLRDAYVPVD